MLKTELQQGLHRGMNRKEVKRWVLRNTPLKIISDFPDTVLFAEEVELGDVLEVEIESDSVVRFVYNGISLSTEENKGD